MTPTVQTDILAPIEIREVPIDDHATIKFHEPLLLQPAPLQSTLNEEDLLDENGVFDDEVHNYVAIDHPELNISVYDNDVEGLRQAVDLEILFCWDNFVKMDDSELDEESRQIKRNYLALAEVVYG